VTDHERIYQRAGRALARGDYETAATLAILAYEKATGRYAEEGDER
jgi:hypothetical protein